MMSQHFLKTTGLSTTGVPSNVSGATPWRLDLSPAAEDKLLVGVSVAVFGFPALVICLICVLRLRVYYVDKRDTKLGFHTTVEESSLLPVEDSYSRGGHVNIKLSTINEALREDDDVDGPCDDKQESNNGRGTCIAMETSYSAKTKIDAV